MEQHSTAPVEAPVRLPPAAALKFVILLGCVGLFADMTYEGARSITGPFLAYLGASGTVVGIVAGFGELVGYGLRLVSGYISTRTGQYWPVTFVGYAINLLAVPALALAGRWEVAAGLMIAERAGRALRVPTRDAMLSHATHEMGRGWGFGLYEALDSAGALVGPLLVAVMLATSGAYASSFAILLIPAVIALVVLFSARMLYPNPRAFETEPPLAEGQGLRRPFWLYLAAMALVAAGYADFPLIAYHFEKGNIVPVTVIPLLYALAMGVEAVGGLALGRLFDRIGLASMIVAVVIAAFFAPLVFLGGEQLALVGMVLWGIGMAALGVIVGATIAEMVPADRRAAAYGIFNTGFGICWFLGSVVLGILYDRSLTVLVIFSVVMQLASIPLLLYIRRLARL